MKNWKIIFSTKDKAIAAYKYGEIYRLNRGDIVVLDISYRVMDIIYYPKEKQLIYAVESMER